MEGSRVVIAFSFSLIAGLSTSIGGLIALISRAKSSRLLSLFLGISVGVMLYVSFVEILPEAIANLQESYGDKIGMQFAVFSFFGGMWLSALIDFLFPYAKDTNLKNKTDDKKTGKNKHKLYRTGMISAIIICIHNFPEGIATFISAMDSPSLAFPIVFAISLHNIPEGITVSAPIYYATGSCKKAFLYSLYTGLTEPLGAIVAYLILAGFMSDVLFGVIFGMVAGIMVFICFDELLPTANEYGDHKATLFGLVIGMAIMATNLVMFA